MANINTDVVVIGSGPGGEGAAMQLAKSGKKVTLVEKYSRIGGGCTHWGTIPSKALRATISQLTDAMNNPLLQVAGTRTQWTMPELLQRARAVISQQEQQRQHYFDRNDVTVIHGQARIAPPHPELVQQPLERGGQSPITSNPPQRTEIGDRPRRLSEKLVVVVEGGTEIQSDHVVIATGSRPYRPDNVDFSHPRIFDSDKILELVEQPRTMTVYGAGIVGCEYASMFRNLDVKINLVNGRARLLDFLDDEISDALSYHLRERGVVIRHNENYERIEGCDDGVILHLASGKHLKTDILLWAVGRTGNSQDMGLEALGIASDSRGYLSVNADFQTSAGNIYAVGDVIGMPSLASAAYTQGRAAAMSILGMKRPAVASSLIPSGIYTSPEISSIGRTERELTEAKIPYEVGQAQFRNLARAQITGQTAGVLKILFHRESRELLGIHCFGANASEIIHIGQAIMAQPAPHNTLDFFLNNTFNYPTMAEAYRVAALNGYNRLF